MLGFELYPGSDVHDGATFEMFLDHTDDHPAACLDYDPSHLLLQQLDYCAFIEPRGERISGFHVKDAEFLPSGRVGVYGGYQPRNKRAGRLRSPGDGQSYLRTSLAAHSVRAVKNRQSLPHRRGGSQAPGPRDERHFRDWQPEAGKLSFNNIAEIGEPLADIIKRIEWRCVAQEPSQKYGRPLIAAMAIHPNDYC